MCESGACINTQHLIHRKLGMGMRGVGGRVCTVYRRVQEKDGWDGSGRGRREGRKDG